MRQPASVRTLEDFGRIRLSNSFFMRDFLYSEIAVINGFQNLPDDPDLAVAAGTSLCTELLEPLQQRFGRLSIRSAYRSPQVNGFGNERGLNCAANEKNYAGHIWDRRDAAGRMGATACIVVNHFIPYYERTGDWEAMAWWIHDQLPYHVLEFFPRYAAFNITWRQEPERQIYSMIPPRRGLLVRAENPNWSGSHAAGYAAMLSDFA